MVGSVAYPGFYNGRSRGAASDERGREWGGGISLPLGEGSEEVVRPLPENF